MRSCGVLVGLVCAALFLVSGAHVSSAATVGSDDAATVFADLSKELVTSEPARPAEKTEEAIAEYKKAREAWSQHKIEALQSFIANFPDAREGYRARLDVASEMLATRQNGAANRVLRQVLANDQFPDLVAEAKVTSAMMYSQTEPEKAAGLLEEALASGIGPEMTPKALNQLADIYTYSVKAPAKARACYQRIIAEYGNHELANVAREAMWTLEIAEKGLLDVGKKPIAFEEKAIDGRPFSPEAYAGKVVLIDFWATWCGPCVGELPNVKEAYAKYHDAGFEILAVSLDSDEAALRDFIAKNEMPWAQFFDGLVWQNKLAKRYGIRGIPATFLLDRNGVIADRDLRGEALAKRVGELVGAQRP